MTDMTTDKILSAAVKEIAKKVVLENTVTLHGIDRAEILFDNTVAAVAEAIDTATATAVAEIRSQADALRDALAFYRDAWKFKINELYGGLEYSPEEILLDDCGNKAKTALDAHDAWKARQ